MTKRRIGEEEFLQSYDITKYNRPSLTADILAIDNDEVLLIKRGNHPYKNYWALVGGFVEENEDIDFAAKRELLEETNLVCDELAQLKTYATPKRDPRGWVVSCVFVAKVSGILQAGDDAQNAQWFKIVQNLKDDILEIKLMGSETLLVKAKIVLNRLNNTLECAEVLHSDLAFDHANILVDGLLALRRWQDGEKKFNFTN